MNSPVMAYFPEQALYATGCKRAAHTCCPPHHAEGQANGHAIAPIDCCTIKHPEYTHYRQSNRDEKVVPSPRNSLLFVGEQATTGQTRNDMFMAPDVPHRKTGIEPDAEEALWL